MRSFPLNALALLAALACCGCGGGAVDLGPTGTISGKLTYNGKPLSEGTALLFMQQKRGFSGVGTTDAEGNFTITHYRKSTGPTPEMPVGEYVVMVQPPDPSGETDDPADTMSPDEAEAAARKQKKPAGLEYPAKYRQPHTSGITREVKEGENTFEIELE